MNKSGSSTSWPKNRARGFIYPRWRPTIEAGVKTQTGSYKAFGVERHHFSMTRWRTFKSIELGDRAMEAGWPSWAVKWGFMPLEDFCNKEAVTLGTSRWGRQNSMRSARGRNGGWIYCPQCDLFPCSIAKIQWNTDSQWAVSEKDRMKLHCLGLVKSRHEKSAWTHKWGRNQRK